MFKAINAVMNMTSRLLGKNNIKINEYTLFVNTRYFNAAQDSKYADVLNLLLCEIDYRVPC